VLGVFKYIEVMMTGGFKVKAYKWTFKARFRRHAFGWRSKPAIQRVKQAVSEINRRTSSAGHSIAVPQMT